MALAAERAADLADERRRAVAPTFAPPPTTDQRQKGALAEGFSVRSQQGSASGLIGAGTRRERAKGADSDAIRSASTPKLKSPTVWSEGAGSKLDARLTLTGRGARSAIRHSAAWRSETRSASGAPGAASSSKRCALTSLRR
jgi:hypothetical protein